MTPSKQTYTEPVASLMGLGDARQETAWPDYLALGLTEQDVPELSRMMLDKASTRSQPAAAAGCPTTPAGRGGGAARWAAGPSGW